jgi:hypothetical protein
MTPSFFPVSENAHTHNYSPKEAPHDRDEHTHTQSHSL